MHLKHRILGTLTRLLTRSRTEVGLWRLRTLEVLERLLAVDTASHTQGTEILRETTLHRRGSDYQAHQRVSVFNTMRIEYHTKVDPDVNYDAKSFATEVAIYLADPDGWGKYHTFVVGDGKSIRLCSQKTMKNQGCKDAKLSCAELNGNEIWLNAWRWIHGAPASKLPLERYRQYVVTHEMGHSLGHDHVKCRGSGPAPVMMQQTLGIGNCTPNTKLTASDLAHHEQ